jgi:hypothetical protein
MVRLRDAAGRVGANLMELEQAPTRALLDAADLDGETATRWARGRTALAHLFAWYASLAALLDKATAVRGTRSTLAAARVAELSDLLLGPSLALSEAAVPLAERELLARSSAMVRTTPDDLLVRMADEYRDVRDVVVQVEWAWSELLPRCRQARDRASAVAELLGQDELSERAELDGWTAELDELCRCLRTDPLSAGAAPLTSIEDHLSRLMREREVLDDLRRRWLEVDAAARARLGELERLDAGTTAHHREIAKKVICARPAPAALDELAQQLAQIERGAQDGRWAVVSSELAGWHQAVDDTTTRLVDGAVADRASLDARRQLRGLVDAYLGKARSLGCLEDARVGELLADLQEELYAAPTDVEHATELVHQLQIALSVPTGELPR